MDDELAQVFVGLPNDAEIMRSVLEANGIAALVRGSGATGGYPLNVGAFAETTVLVPAKNAEIARKLLRSEDLGTPARPDREPASTVATSYAFRRSVMRWFALLVLLVMVATLVMSLDSIA